MKKSVSVLLIATLFLVSLGFMSAVAMVAPVAGANYSGSFFINCSYTNLTTDIYDPIASNSTFFWNISGSFVNFTNVWGLAVTNNSVSGYVNVTDVSDGNASIRCGLGNATSTWYKNATTMMITLDKTAPLVTINAPSNALNTTSTGIILLSANATDALVGVHKVLFNITYGNNATVIDKIWGAAVGANYSNTTAWNVSSYGDGLYKVIVQANDTLGNVNTSQTSLVYLDRVAPQLTFTEVLRDKYNIKFNVTITDATTKANGTCVVSAGSISGSGATQEVQDGAAVNGINLVCGVAHSYDVTCWDMAGTVNTTTVTYSTTNCVNGDGSSGSSSSNEVEVTATGHSEDIYVGNSFSFKNNGESHSLKIKSIVSGAVTIELASTPQTATINAGESRKFDLNSDGYYDILVSVMSIVGNKVSVDLQAINEKIIVPVVNPPVQETKPSAPVVNPPTQPIKEEAKSSILQSVWFWVVIVVIIIVVVAMIIRARK